MELNYLLIRGTESNFVETNHSTEIDRAGKKPLVRNQ